MDRPLDGTPLPLDYQGRCGRFMVYGHGLADAQIVDSAKELLDMGWRIEL